MKPVCETCKAAFVELLNDRRILDIGYKEAQFQKERGNDPGPDPDVGQSHCFHLLEIIAILEGRHTCGVFDDHGKPPTVKGPLFEES